MSCQLTTLQRQIEALECAVNADEQHDPCLDKLLSHKKHKLLELKKRFYVRGNSSYGYQKSD
jgi:hypothetical protein